ncbi:hypothetical protein SNEBB_011408 [Seison nebaliae]|nr:hypothetical protein SNEBB_011408 [Seison nebaliae]
MLKNLKGKLSSFCSCDKCNCERFQSKQLKISLSCRLEYIEWNGEETEEDVDGLLCDNCEHQLVQHLSISESKLERNCWDLSEIIDTIIEFVHYVRHESYWKKLRFYQFPVEWNVKNEKFFYLFIQLLRLHFNESSGDIENFRIMRQSDDDDLNCQQFLTFHLFSVLLWMKPTQIELVTFILAIKEFFQQLAHVWLRYPDVSSKYYVIWLTSILIPRLNKRIKELANFKSAYWIFGKEFFFQHFPYALDVIENETMRNLTNLLNEIELIPSEHLLKKRWNYFLTMTNTMETIDGKGKRKMESSKKKYDLNDELKLMEQFVILEKLMIILMIIRKLFNINYSSRRYNDFIIFLENYRELIEGMKPLGRIHNFWNKITLKNLLKRHEIFESNFRIFQTYLNSTNFFVDFNSDYLRITNYGKESNLLNTREIGSIIDKCSLLHADDLNESHLEKLITFSIKNQLKRPIDWKRYFDEYSFNLLQYCRNRLFSIHHVIFFTLNIDQLMLNESNGFRQVKLMSLMNANSDMLRNWTIDSMRRIFSDKFINFIDNRIKRSFPIDSDIDLTHVNLLLEQQEMMVDLHLGEMVKLGKMEVQKELFQNLFSGNIAFLLIRYDEKGGLDLNNSEGFRILFILLQYRRMLRKQLPNIGILYLTSLLFHPYHWSLILVDSEQISSISTHMKEIMKEKDLKKRLCLIKEYSFEDNSKSVIIGGVTFLPFPNYSMCELVFLAVSQQYQGMQFGLLLLNAFRELMASCSLFYIFTYADRFAQHFFRKFGFTQMQEYKYPKVLYDGLLKHYAGASLMGMEVIANVPYVMLPLYFQIADEYFEKDKELAKFCKTVLPSPALDDDELELMEDFFTHGDIRLYVDLQRYEIDDTFTKEEIVERVKTLRSFETYEIIDESIYTNFNLKTVNIYPFIVKSKSKSYNRRANELFNKIRGITKKLKRDKDRMVNLKKLKEWINDHLINYRQIKIILQNFFASQIIIQLFQTYNSSMDTHRLDEAQWNEWIMKDKKRQEYFFPIINANYYYFIPLYEQFIELFQQINKEISKEKNCADERVLSLHRFQILFIRFLSTLTLKLSNKSEDKKQIFSTFAKEGERIVLEILNKSQ